MGDHVALLSNPQSGKGRGAATARLALARLHDRGVEVRVYEGGSAAETGRLARDAVAAGPSVLIVVGGDGTLSGILDVVCASALPVALVPAGTGNDLARALGLPRHDPAAAVDIAVTGRRRAIDVGVIRTPTREALFLTIAALGFDAKVSDRTNRLRWPHGRLRYYLAVIVELLRLRPMEFSVSIDGSPVTRSPGTLVAVGNTASYGGGMPLCVGAAADDGLLDVVQVEPLTRARLVRLFPLLLQGRHLARPEVARRRARSVTVSAPDLVVYADGERIGERECRLGVRPGALTMMVPSASETTDA